MQTFIPRDEADLRVRLINLSGKLFIYFLFIVWTRLSFFSFSFFLSFRSSFVPFVHAFSHSFPWFINIFLFQSTLSYIKRTSNLEAYIEWFNRLGYLVATEVCLVSIKFLWTEFDRAGRENIWLSVIRTSLCLVCFPDLSSDSVNKYIIVVSSLVHL